MLHNYTDLMNVVKLLKIYKFQKYDIIHFTEFNNFFCTRLHNFNKTKVIIKN